MNIYEKIQFVKVKLLEANIKKSGQNKFAGYTYYELADFTPYIIKFCEQMKLFTAVSFDKELARLKIVNAENPEEFIEYTSPMEQLELKGCNKIQALGGVETYSRRYLYMSAFDIIENDMFDAVVDESNNTIDKTKVEALKKSISNNNIDETQVIKVLSKYNYTKLEQIKIKDYMPIVNELKP